MGAWRAGAVGLAAAALACFAAVAPANLASSGSERRAITAAEARAWQPDMRAARRYANSRRGDISFAVVDLAGRLHHENGGGRARMASTFKVMLMVAYLRRVGDRALTDDERALIRPMIRKSANDPATRIRDMLGREPIEKLARKAGMKHFRWNDIWGYCLTSARDQAFFMRRLHRYVPDRHWGFAKRQLAKIVKRQRWGIARVAPDGWKLHFKGGWGSGTGLVDHQVAFLQHANRRLGIAILTEGNPDHAYGKRTLRGVAARLLRGLPAAR